MNKSSELKYTQTFLEEFQASSRKWAGIVQVAALALIVAGLVALTKQIMDLPLVEVSQSTGKCVKVYTPQGMGSCDALPIKYEKVYVK